MLWGLLIFAILATVAVYVGLAVSRARREQRARSEERAAALLGSLQARAAAGAAAAAPGAGPASAAAKPAVAPHAERSAPAAAATGGSARADEAPLRALRRARFLTDPQRLLYLLLRTALPDHIVMANVRLIDFLDLPASAEAVEQSPRLVALLHQRIDCVVCRSDLTPVAALAVYPGSIERIADDQAKAEPLRELGVRFLKFRADSLPRPAVIRSLVLG